MADIELVIKISEELYKQICEIAPKFEDCSLEWEAITNGTPLPKGHGDLIDRKELKKEVYTITEWNGDVHRIVYEASVDDAKPIIEADKGEQYG